ncbi:MAG TPA: sulfide/dihydroorotate dehydrogenase-like FAD/NAD-binding protein [Phycisphaerae bacterium]|nr:sulfide/dihydroorotate dehydrogenase-like FAD/NAD-binding protein [Phycisphaerae bacterium]HPS53888.1 sulfide/dihydroorotate dehydrogenase-like FAD/NAD-binding protein [Phycisphaerae bacterium]
MFEVIKNEVLADNLHRLVLKAPRIASARKPGQFVIIRSSTEAERIPLTIADADAQAGTITIIVQAVGQGTREICDTPQGESLRDVAGPLGRPTHLEKWGRVACVGGGVGTAVLYPLAAGAAKLGNEVTTIIGARNASLVILKDELARFSKEVLIATEDGSMGTKGFVTTVLGELIADESRRPHAIFAVGPVPMMAAVSEQTRPYGIPTFVSLNPIMVDGTGMCGGCRVTVGGEIKFACVDGPEFDAHKVDFKELSSRQSTYRDEHFCRLDAKIEQLRKEAGK